ncbi:MAG: hypothetical protein ABJL54_08055 [Halioglobus sp.]
MKVLQKTCLLAFALLMPMSVALAQTPAADAVSAALAGGQSPGAIIEMLTSEPSSMALEDATLAAMDAGGESNQNAFASAGIAAARNMVEAEAVAAAVREAGVDPALIDAAMAQYVEFMDQPFIHHDASDPTGGGAYNPQGPGGGVIPPIGPPRPPVSPAN